MENKFNNGSKTIELKKEKIATQARIAAEVFDSVELNMYQGIEDMLVAQLVGFVYSNTADERELQYTVEPPTFFDWLFKKRKTVRFNFKAKDLLLNPPPEIGDKKFLRTYETYLNNDKYTE